MQLVLLLVCAGSMHYHHASERLEGGKQWHSLARPSVATPSLLEVKVIHNNIIITSEKSRSWNRETHHSSFLREFVKQKKLTLYEDGTS